MTPETPDAPITSLTAVNNSLVSLRESFESLVPESHGKVLTPSQDGIVTVDNRRGKYEIALKQGKEDDIVACSVKGTKTRVIIKYNSPDLEWAGKMVFMTLPSLGRMGLGFVTDEGYPPLASGEVVDPGLVERLQEALSAMTATLASVGQGEAKLEQGIRLPGEVSDGEKIQRRRSRSVGALLPLTEETVLTPSRESMEASEDTTDVLVSVQATPEPVDAPVEEIPQPVLVPQTPEITPVSPEMTVQKETQGNPPLLTRAEALRFLFALQNGFKRENSGKDPLMTWFWAFLRHSVKLCHEKIMIKLR